MKDDKNQTWHEYYEKRLTKTDIHSEIIRKKRTRADTIEAVMKNSGVKRNILEAGCGTSVLSIILNRAGYQNYCIDNDIKMLEMAKIFNREAGTQVQYCLGGIFELPFANKTFDTIFSHGVLEHFNEENIVKAINEGLRVADTYVISFPTIVSRGHPALYGDENLWSYFYWKKIINNSDAYIYTAYSMYPRKTIKGFLNKIFRKKLYFISSELGFVLKTK